MISSMREALITIKSACCMRNHTTKAHAARFYFAALFTLRVLDRWCLQQQ
jgi:hypothetical protein